MLVHWYVRFFGTLMSVLFGFDVNVISSIRRSINIGVSINIAVSTMHNRISWSFKW